MVTALLPFRETRDTNYTNCPKAMDGSNPKWSCKIPVLCSAKNLKKSLPKFRLPINPWATTHKVLMVWWRLRSKRRFTLKLQSTS